MKELFKKALLVVLLFALLPTATTWAQECNKCVSKNASITFLGIDYTFLNFGETLDESEEKIIEVYIPAWNNMFEVEQKKYDVAKSFNLTNLSYNIDFFKAQNAKIKNIKGPRKQAITDATIKNHVNSLNFKGITSDYALFFLATDYSKAAVNATHYFVIYDLKSKKTLVLSPIDTKPGGFGFRNYWAASFYNILKSGKKITKDWIQ